MTSRTAVQFSAEGAGIADAVAHAITVDLLEGVPLRVATVTDLIALKLAAAAEGTRRLSKRQHDMADVLALLEEHPELEAPAIRDRLNQIQTALLHDVS